MRCVNIRIYVIFQACRNYIYMLDPTSVIYWIARNNKYYIINCHVFTDPFLYYRLYVIVNSWLHVLMTKTKLIVTELLSN